MIKVECITVKTEVNLDLERHVFYRLSLNMKHFLILSLYTDIIAR
jgi:hypothetical protein